MLGVGYWESCLVFHNTSPDLRFSIFGMFCFSPINYSVCFGFWILVSISLQKHIKKLSETVKVLVNSKIWNESRNSQIAFKFQMKIPRIASASLEWDGTRPHSRKGRKCIALDDLQRRFKGECMLNKVRVSSDKKRALRQTKLEIPQLHMKPSPHNPQYMHPIWRERTK